MVKFNVKKKEENVKYELSDYLLLTHKNTKKLKLLSVAAGNAKSYSHFGNQFSSFLQS